MYCVCTPGVKAPRVGEGGGGRYEVKVSSVWGEGGGGGGGNDHVFCGLWTLSATSRRDLCCNPATLN